MGYRDLDHGDASDYFSGIHVAFCPLHDAASELLEALLEMLAAVELEGANGLRFHEARNSGLAAIAKATRAALSNPATEPDREAKHK